MKKLFKNVKKGFTIVELVIVIGVIAILSAILIPTFVNLNQKASDAALQSDLTNAYSMYVADAVDGVEDATTKQFHTLLASEKIAVCKTDVDPDVYYVRNAETGVWAKDAAREASAYHSVLVGEGNYFTVGVYTVYYFAA